MTATTGVGRPRRTLVAVWLVVAAALGDALLVAELTHDPLDDPDPAYQRPGLLDGRHDDGSVAAPVVADGIPAPGLRAVVFFVRPGELSALVRALEGHSDLRARARVAIVVASAPPPGAALDAVPVVADPAGRLAARYAMRRPRDGGPPVGVAVVDRTGRVRYRTLDPGVAGRLDEVATILADTP